MPQYPNRTAIDRRTFLLSALGTSAGLIWPGCSSDSSRTSPLTAAGRDAGLDAAVDSGGAATEGGLDGGMTPNFGVLQALRDAVRSSPDHLSARAAEAIAAKDPLRAIRLVRDSIAVLPPPDGNTAAVDAVRWGPAATLRAGAGTLRERAELLAAMLEAMGATADVVRAARPSNVSLAALYGTTPAAFAADASRLARLAATKAGADATKLNDPSTDADPTSLVKSLLGMLPDGTAVAKAPFDGDDAIVPVVEYTFGGTKRWAFAMGSVDEVSSEPASLGAKLTAPDYPTVSVRVLGVFGDVPGVPTSNAAVELVKGSWTADQVAGRRLTVAFLPPNLSEAISAPPSAEPIRAAALTLQGAPQDGASTDSAYQVWQPPTDTKPQIAFIGDPFTLSGERFTTNGDGSLAGPYGDIQTLDTSSHQDAAASVKTLEVDANGGAFPDVQLTVRALDGSGAPVFGLGVNDFVITDESNSERALLVSNAKVGDVRVLVAYDCSLSIMWPTPADKTAFDNALAQALVSSAAKNPFKLAVTPLGGSASASAFTAPVASDIVTTVSSCAGFSDLWTTLGQIAVEAGVSAAILVSDFDASDAPESIPGLQQRLAASGLQVALIPTAGAKQDVIDQIVSIAGATQLDPLATDFQSKLDDFVTKATERVTNSGYRFSYQVSDAQQTNSAMRTATVALARDLKVSGDATYTVPAAAQRGLRGVTGLSLEIRVGPDTVQRWLSGPHATRFGTFPTPTATDIADTLALLTGTVTVAFEPGSPTVAANLDDLVSGVLSLEPLSRMVGMPTAAGLKAAASFHPYGGSLAALVHPVKRFDTGPVVAPRTLRVVIESQSSRDGNLVDRFDLVPELNRSVAASADAAAAFSAVMAASVGSSLREAAVGFSSADALSKASLQYIAPSAAVTTLKGFSADDLTRWGPILDQYGDYHRFVPTTPTIEALWIVDPATGSTFALYLDGTGGTCRQAKWNAELQADLAILAIYASYKGVQCEAAEPAPFACTGALVANVFIGVATLFAAGTLDSISFLDIVLLVIGTIAGPGPAPVGLALSILTGAVSVGEAAMSVNEHCP
jgi:hypothetical protein